MQYCYVSTFISGLSEVVKKLITNELPDAEIIQTFDGMIIYKSSDYDKIKKIKFFNNTFLLLGIKINKDSNSFNNDMNNLIQQLKMDFSAIKKHIKDIKSRNFKILSIDKNQPVSINYNIVNKLENSIIKNLNIKLNKKNPDLEFIFLRRTEGFMLFMLKLTYNRITEKKLAKGELRPELAYILSALADLKNTDIVMDPFCGHGSIPKQIIKNFKYNMCFASDNNEELILKLKNEYKKNNKKLFIKQRNALELSYFEDDFIDAIITDPPWNIYNSQNENFTNFYEKMLAEFNRIIKPGGRIIILMGNIDDFESAFNKQKNFLLKNKYNILVNGKKANIYCLINKQ